MKSTCTIRRGQAAYTMVELMVAMLISVILMVAMYQIFARVQKVFTEGNHRGKMYEEGRAVMDLIVRDLEQIAPSGFPKEDFPLPGVPWDADQWGLLVDDDYHRFYGCNFMAWPYITYTNGDPWEAHQVLEVEYSKLPIPTHPGWQDAISEPLISSRVEFFTNEDGGVSGSEKWRVMGYRLYSQNNPVIRNTEIIGALWRFESNPGPKEGALGLLNTALDLRENGDLNYRKLSDNVIHFRMRAVSRDDHPLNDSLEKPSFDGDNVPLYVEVELGIIEERLKKEILNDAEVERYDVMLEDDPSHPSAKVNRRNRIMKMLAAKTDRILMLRQIVRITSPN